MTPATSRRAVSRSPSKSRRAEFEAVANSGTLRGGSRARRYSGLFPDALGRLEPEGGRDRTDRRADVDALASARGLGQRPAVARSVGPGVERHVPRAVCDGVGFWQ